MHDDDTAAITATYTANTDHPIAVVDGYGAQIRVTNRHLVLKDGIGPHRRHRRYHKATHRLQRLIVIGDSGIITFAALRWLHDTGVAYTQLDRDANVLATTAARGLDNAKLRRAQALAATNHIGIEATRTLLRHKLNGQRRVATDLTPDDKVVDQLERHISNLDTADTAKTLRQIEAAAASAYWQAWNDLPVQFPKAHRQRLPEHWLTFGTRTSPLTASPRLAANPANAILNYLYALLEAEATIACATAGLDPGIGILHADQPNRASLALDVMEAARPDVDAYLLDLLRGHRFAASDFHETRRGVCRVLAPLTHRLAETTTTWAEQLGPIIDELIRGLATTPGIKLGRIATPLTQANRSRGRDAVRRRQPATERKPKASHPKQSRCESCGVEIASRNRRCGECNVEYQTARMAETRSEQWEQRRRTGDDPSHGGTAAARRGLTNRSHQNAIAAWQPGDQPTDPSYYRATILPTLADVRPRTIADAAQVSDAYARQIRSGAKTPHPRHWATLQQLGAAGSDA